MSQFIQSKTLDKTLGITLVDGVLTITDNEGLAISESNPVEVYVKSVNGGQRVPLKLTSGASISDDTTVSSHLTGITLGITGSSNWQNDMPWFIGRVNEDDTADNVGFFLTRDPTMTVTPAASAIHDLDAAAGTDTQNSIIGMWNDDAGKAGKPCEIIGAVRVRYLASTTDWTFQTLGNTDGIGPHALDATFATEWNFPSGHPYGTSYFQTTNGPSWATPSAIVYTYTINRDGIVHAKFSTVGAGNCTNGSSASDASFGIPYAAKTTGRALGSSGESVIGGTTYFSAEAYRVYTSGTSYVVANNTVVNGNVFSNTSDYIDIGFIYKAF